MNIFCFSGPAHVLPPFEVDQLTKVAYTEAPITLSFVVAGGGNIESVQWWINGVLVTISGSFSIDSNTRALTINNITFDDSGFYQAEVITDQSVRAELKNFLLDVKRKTIYLTTFKNILLERTFIDCVTLKPSCCVSQTFSTRISFVARHA